MFFDRTTTIIRLHNQLEQNGLLKPITFLFILLFYLLALYFLKDYNQVFFFVNILENIFPANNHFDKNETDDGQT